MAVQRYFIEIAYDGSRYHGWQVQPNAISVQEVLNKALSTILREDIHVVGAGRTDTGVHAKQLFAHFDLTAPIEEEKLAFRLNSFLPDDISVQSLHPVSKEAHSRFDALHRKYEYYLSPKKSPFVQQRAWVMQKPLDVLAMNAAAKLLIGEKDFSCFSKSDTQTKTNICDIKEAYWEEKEGLLVFHVKANRFLRNMVRAIVGTLVEVGLGKKKVEELEEVLASKSRAEAGVSAPACGLYLVEVAYPKEVWND
jgi:tRNA pseudouridine38-40 synthase